MSININSTVAAVFPDVTTAELVTRHLGHEYKEGSHRDLLSLKQNKKAVLDRANEMQEEAAQKAD